MEKQEKLSNEELGKYRSFLIGMAMPAGEQAGFIGVFGLTAGDDSLVLLDEFESPDIIEMVDSLAWLTVKFSFRDATYPYGDFIFADEADDALRDMLAKRRIKLAYSPLSFGKEEQKPFMTLLPQINQARRDGIIIVGDEMLLSIRLKDEVLQNPANVRFGDAPALESLCYAYFGWQELKRQGTEQPEIEETYNCLTWEL